MRTTLLAALLVLFAAAGAAHTGHATHAVVDAATNTTLQEFLDEPAALADRYNNNTGAVPGALRALIADERINVHITGTDGNTTIGAVMDDIRIAEMRAGGVDNATVTFTMSETTLASIVNAESPPRAAVAALNSGAIRYEVVGLWNSIVYGVMSVLLRIFGGLI